jgi:hypothetical protein
MVAHIGEIINVYKILVRKPEGKRPCRRPSVGIKIILEWITGKEDGKVWLDVSGSGYGSVLGSCEHGNEPSSSIKCGEFHD